MYLNTKIFSKREVLFFLLYEKCKKVPSRDHPNTHPRILLRVAQGRCEDAETGDFVMAVKHHQHRHQGEAKNENFLPLHMAEASAQGDSNVTAADRAVALKDGCRKRRMNSQLLRS